MGWKAVRDHYRIEHLVQVTSEGICIGSPYVHDIIVVKGGERVRSNYGVRASLSGDLKRIVDEMDADPFNLAGLAEKADDFAISIPVYTYEGGSIIEKQCEELGWPNVTHDGCMQFENAYSPDPGLVRTWAIDNARAGIEWRRERVEQATAALAKAETDLAQREADLRQLEGTNP